VGSSTVVASSHHTALPPPVRWSTPQLRDTAVTSASPRPVEAVRLWRTRSGMTGERSWTVIRIPSATAVTWTPTGVPACRTALVTSSETQSSAAAMTSVSRIPLSAARTNARARGVLETSAGSVTAVLRVSMPQSTPVPPSRCPAV
jgi:hypothetical protein